ncbi:hypothetical protein DL96DRAFT_122838 [Flagelloscypha sp. PMI_526]|nr:hypothetical protein DL96DRAFT_122838 [Flagelloscypha sp. PMI_526]
MSPATVQVAAQWANPSDFLSLLLLIGSDTIQKAIAQQAGDYLLPTPVVFSFGWVPYAWSAVITCVTSGTLLPSPDHPCSVIHVKTGNSRVNEHWMIGRILRDFETLWIPKNHQHIVKTLHLSAGRAKAGLCLSVLQATKTHNAYMRRRDFWWWSGYGVAILQLIISIVPWGLKKNWSVFAITVAGTALAFIRSSLPHWTEELLKARIERFNSNHTFILTRGGGWAQYAVLLLGASHGLSYWNSSVPRADPFFAPSQLLKPSITSAVFLSLAVLWSILLITSAGITDHRWYLLAVGVVGMVHTFIIAAVPRSAQHYGLHVEEKCCLVDKKVMRVLEKAEYIYPGVGRSLLPVYFPGLLRQDERTFWSRAALSEEERRRNSVYY